MCECCCCSHNATKPYSLALSRPMIISINFYLFSLYLLGLMLRLYFLNRDNPQIYSYFTKWVVLLLEVVWNFLSISNTSLSLSIDFYEYFGYFPYFLRNSLWSQTISVPEFLVLQLLNKRVFRSICLFDRGLYLLKSRSFQIPSRKGFALSGSGRLSVFLWRKARFCIIIILGTSFELKIKFL